MASSIVSFFISCFISVSVCAILLNYAAITPVTELSGTRLIACIAVYIFFIISLHKKVDSFIIKLLRK